MASPSVTETGKVGDLLAFFGLTFLLTVPFWLLGAFSGAMLMPGLPIAALSVVCPAAAALILTVRRQGPKAGLALLRRVADGGLVRPAWWPVIVLITPAISLAAFLILRLDGSAMPDPAMTLPGVVLLLALFLVSALLEELGWTGFALERFPPRWGAALAGLAIGAVWALWHYPALIQAHRAADWIAWWTLGTISLRVIMVQLHHRSGGSLFGVAVLHAMSNLSWQVFPVRGSWFDPQINGLLMAGVALALFAFRPAPPPHGRRTTPSPPG